jgi:hypothetical protein
MIKHIADLALRNGFEKTKIVATGQRKVAIFHQYKYTVRAETHAVYSQIQTQVYTSTPACAKSQLSQTPSSGQGMFSAAPLSFEAPNTCTHC